MTLVRTHANKSGWAILTRRSRAGSGVIRIYPLLDGCPTRRLNQVLSVLSWPIYAYWVCLCCLIGPLLVYSLVRVSTARETPLRKPSRGEGIVSTNPRPESVYTFFRFSVLFHCLIVCLSYPLRVIFYMSYGTIHSLFVLKVPLNTNQSTNRTLDGAIWTGHEIGLGKPTV